MRDITEWLEELGLGEYAEAFAENKIDFGILPELSGDDLRELDIPLGPRKYLLRLFRACFAELFDRVNIPLIKFHRVLEREHPKFLGGKTCPHPLLDVRRTSGNQ